MHQWPSPLIIAHRGASAHAPENTLAAFELALQQGATGIELDVKLSNDKEIVVIHDAKIDRTTNKSGWVSKMTLAAIQELDAGSFFSPKFSHERIPTLAEVFDLIGNQAMINIELSNYVTPYDELIVKVCQLVQEFGFHNNILFSSFLASNLNQARNLLPEIPRGLLAWKGWIGWWSRSFGFNFGDYQALHSNLYDVTAQQVSRVHRLKRRIYVWTVNTAEDVRRLFTWGVDGLITDDPELAKKELLKVT